MKHYEIYGKKKDREQFLEDLDTEELQNFGKQSSRNIMKHYNYDLTDSLKTTRIDHNRQTRDIFVMPTFKKGRAM